MLLLHVPSLRDRLLGAWSLQDYVACTEEGRVHHPLGADAPGLLVYTASGHMTAQLMATDRPRWPRAGDEDRLPHIAAIAESYLAYAGTFEVDEIGGTVVHHVTLSLLPNWVGRPQHRLVDLDGDRLVLSVGGATAGAPPTHRLSWARLAEL
jgi:hypothetical protein